MASPTPGASPAPSPTVQAAAAVKAPAKIRVRRAGVRSGRLDVLAEVTRRASGTVTVTYRAAGRSIRFRSTIRDGRIRFTRRLTGAQRRKPTGIVTLRYGGDGDVRPDEVRLRAANGRAQLRRTRAEIRDGRLRVAGTISRRARGVVRIRLGYVAGGDVAFRYVTARIAGGRWSVDVALPAAAAAGGQLSIQFTGDERAGLRGEQDAKAVAP